MNFVGRPQLLEQGRGQERALRGRHARPAHRRLDAPTRSTPTGLGNPAAGAGYTIVHVGEELRDPDDGDLLGYIGHYAGTGEVIQTTGAVVPGSSRSST